MKIKSFIFVFFLCAIIFISVVATRPSKFEKQFGATEESKTKDGIDGNGGWRRGHDNGDWVGSGTWGGWGGGGGGEDKEHEEETGDEHEGDWEGKENEAPGPTRLYL
ncbi:hypothetical protein TSUD_248770 [Trifolium subterraneum]|uniref:Nodule-specific Glycine Rich Peptide n=1 Tax=Trifolium subterraneum TaxID=3900 RepID=A0A2Z6LPB3_TRISU|nr:hypothetical protein TSUD_248770 [Trifolium subterraneum]